MSENLSVFLKLQLPAKKYGKIRDIKKKLSPQSKQWNIQWAAAGQLPPTIADF